MRKRGLAVYIASFLLAVFFPVSCIRAEAEGKNDSMNERQPDRQHDSLFISLQGLPDDIRARIESDPEGFSELARAAVSDAERLSGNLLFPVDRSNLLSEDFIPSDLVSLDRRGLLLNKEGMMIRNAVLPALEKMCNDASSDGIKIVISSAYRSFPYQKNLYEYYISVHGKEETDKFSAPPGASQHQLGTALDFGSISMDFLSTDAGIWMGRNAWKYGFSLSYPQVHEAQTGYQYEPWHFRYVTESGALLERKYFLGLQYVMLEYLYNHGKLFSELEG